jgi:hypothetical protein
MEEENRRLRARVAALEKELGEAGRRLEQSERESGMKDAYILEMEEHIQLLKAQAGGESGVLRVLAEKQALNREILARCRELTQI